MGKPGPPTVYEIITYVVVHETAAIALALLGLLLIGIVSMTFVLLDHKRNPRHPFEFLVRNETVDTAWRQVGEAWTRRLVGAAVWRAIRAFWVEYQHLKPLSDMGRLDWALISGGVKVALAVVSIDTLVLIARVFDWVSKR